MFLYAELGTNMYPYTFYNETFVLNEKNLIPYLVFLWMEMSIMLNENFYWTKDNKYFK